jgi:hypothetical protein
MSATIYPRFTPCTVPKLATPAGLEFYWCLRSGMIADRAVSTAVSDRHQDVIVIRMFGGRCCVDGKWAGLTTVAPDQMAKANSAKAAGSRCLGSTSKASS